MSLDGGEWSASCPEKVSCIHWIGGWLDPRNKSLAHAGNQNLVPQLYSP
jgi:hypothetical protein